MVRYGRADITLLDEEKLAKVQQHIGIAFQSGGLFNSLTVAENVALPLREYGHMDERLIEAVVRLKLSLVGLAAAQHLKPEELSGGMRKRAGLARALALDPPVVFFDEPSAGLDPIMASGLDELILELRKLLGITFIIVTHELDSIRKVADRVLMLDQGKAVFIGTVAQAENSQIARVRQFFERRADEHIAQRTMA
jgi:phospholipid/cholesterol/gamma-HCH transport system ATP-binding protein